MRFLLRTLVFAGLLLAGVLAMADQDFSYALYHGVPVKVLNTSGRLAEVRHADGPVRSYRAAELLAVEDPVAVANYLNLRLLFELKPVEDTWKSLKTSFAAEFDDGVLEMMTALLALKEGQSESVQQGILLDARESRIHRLVDDFRSFDVDRLVSAVNQVDFASAFISSALAWAESGRAALEREKRWQDAQQQVQTGDARMAIRQNMIDLDRQMQDVAAWIGDLKKQAEITEKTRARISRFQEDYFSLYDKTTELLTAYSAIRICLDGSGDSARAESLVEALTGGIGRDFLSKETLVVGSGSAAALAELQKRRKPQLPSQPKQYAVAEEPWWAKDSSGAGLVAVLFIPVIAVVMGVVFLRLTGSSSSRPPPKKLRVRSSVYPSSVLLGQDEVRYWLTPGSYTRHNENCRFYRRSDGRYCQKDEGFPCKICGG